jgi:GTP cyclohydrolase I
MANNVATTPAAQKALVSFRQGFEKILEGLAELGYDTSDENFKDTATRAAKGLAELTLSNELVEREIQAMLQRTFPAKYDEMVISKHNVAFGVCPHHLMPVILRISVAYIPKDKVLGISKLSRLCHLMARRPVLQEDLTHELSTMLHESLESRGAAAYVEGLHMCMAARGVEAHEARVVTSAVRGVFRDQPETRQEFLDLVTMDHPKLL